MCQSFLGMCSLIRSSNAQLPCFHCSLGMLVFSHWQLWTLGDDGRCQICRSPTHLTSVFSPTPSQDHCPSPDFPPVSFCHAVSLLQCLGLSPPALISTPSHCWATSFLSLVAEWGAASWFSHLCCSKVKYNRSPSCVKGDTTPC